MKRIASLLLALCLCLGLAAGPGLAESYEIADMFSDRDYKTDYSDPVTIVLADGASTADGSGVAIAGNTVTITAKGTYLLTGELTNGQIVVEAGEDDKVQLVLSGARVTCSGSAALYVKDADKVFVTTAEGTDNLLASTGEFAADGETNVDGAVFAKCDLTLNGLGALTVESETGHGVVTKDDLCVTSGRLTVKAAKKGLSGKDSVRVAGGEINIESGTDGIHSEHDENAEKGFVYIAGGNLTVRAGRDAISASAALTIVDGTLLLVTGDGSDSAASAAAWNTGRGGMGGYWGNAQNGADSESRKGLKSDTAIRVSGGSISIDSEDDSVHSNGTVEIAGGELILSSGDDGMHADETLTVLGGVILISQSYEGIEGKNILISGGDISVTASDDGLNAAGGNDGSSMGGRFGQNGFGDSDASASLTISGGTLRVNAGGDGLDSNGALLVSGGLVLVSGPTNSGNGALDYGMSAAITGGTVVAVGASGMAENFGAESTQCAILVNLSSAQAAGSTITLTDQSGAVLVSFTAEKTYQSVVISTPDLAVGGTYTLTAGNEKQTIQLTSTIYGSGSGMFGMGGFGRGGNNMNGGQTSGEQMPGGQMPGGQVPGGQMPGGQVPGGQMPGGQNQGGKGNRGGRG